MFESNNVIYNINILPEDMVNYEIFPYIANDVLVSLNKDYYTKLHKCVKKTIRNMEYERYIRCIVRSDNITVFVQLLEENFDKWLKMYKYKYKSYIFENYLRFLIHFCVEHDSHKCRELINDKGVLVMKEKWHKNSKVRDCRWSN